MFNWNSCDSRIFNFFTIAYDSIFSLSWWMCCDVIMLMYYCPTGIPSKPEWISYHWSCYYNLRLMYMLLECIIYSNLDKTISQIWFPVYADTQRCWVFYWCSTITAVMWSWEKGFSCFKLDAKWRNVYIKRTVRRSVDSRVAKLQGFLFFFFFLGVFFCAIFIETA